MKDGEITIISGVFESEEARELMLSLINQKIRFHHLRSFSMQERLGTKDVTSETRIKELIKARMVIMDYLLLAKSLGCNLSLKSTISIKLLPSTNSMD